MQPQSGILRAQLARRTGCNLETVRYYEKVGLLPAPARNANGYRVYSPELVQRLQFILRARDLSFAMDEIRSLLSLTDVGAQTCAEVMGRTQAHLDDVRRRIADLQKIEAALATTLGRVDKRDSHSSRLLIQDCFLRSSHGSWGLVGCGMGADWAAAAA